MSQASCQSSGGSETEQFDPPACGSSRETALATLAFEERLLRTRYLAFAGSGTRCSVYLGFLRMLQTGWSRYAEYHSRLLGCIGVSSGSIAALAALVGADTWRVFEAVRKKAQTFQNGEVFDVDVSRLLHRYGVDDGTRLKELIRVAMTEMGLDADQLTFARLRTMTGKEFAVLVTRLSDSEPVVMNHVSFPHLAVAKAIYMSCTIPFLFSPLKVVEGEWRQDEGTRGGEGEEERAGEEIYCDGGMVSNVPFTHFPVDETTVLTLHSSKGSRAKIESLKEFGMCAALCMLSAQKHALHLHERYNPNAHVVRLKHHLITKTGPITMQSDANTACVWFKAGFDEAYLLLRPDYSNRLLASLLPWLVGRERARQEEEEQQQQRTLSKKGMEESPTTVEGQVQGQNRATDGGGEQEEAAYRSASVVV